MKSVMRSLSLGLLLLISASGFGQSASLVSSGFVPNNVSSIGVGLSGNSLLVLAFDSGSVQVTSVNNTADNSPCSNCALVAALSNGTVNRLELWNAPTGGNLTFNFSAPVKLVVSDYSLSAVGGFTNVSGATGSANPMQVATTVTTSGDGVVVAFARQGTGRLGTVAGCLIDHIGWSTTTNGSLQNVTGAFGANNNQPSGLFSCSVNIDSFHGAKLGSPWAGIAVELTP